MRTARFLVMLIVLGTFFLANSAAGLGQEREASILKKVESITKGEKIKLEAKAFIRYWWQVQDPTVQGAGDKEPNANSFEVWRFYFGPKVEVTPWLTVRLTADVGPESSETTEEAADGHTHKVPGSSRYEFFIKYAYADFRLAPKLHLEAGMIGNPHHGFTDKLWGGRYVAKNVGDANKLWNSADLGFDFSYELPGKLGSVGLGFVNGSGYKHALDNDANKELWLHAELAPLASLGELAARFKLAFILQYDVPIASGDEQALLLSGLLGYQGPNLAVGYQIISRLTEPGDNASVTGLAHGAYLRWISRFNVGVLGRLSMWDADLDSDNVQTSYEALGGIFYTPISFCEFALSGSGAWRSELAGVDEEADIRVMLSTQFVL
mgnify:CR=1 FL=1